MGSLTQVSCGCSGADAGTAAACCSKLVQETFDRVFASGARSSTRKRSRARLQARPLKHRKLSRNQTNIAIKFSGWDTLRTGFWNGAARHACQLVIPRIRVSTVVPVRRSPVVQAGGSPALRVRLRAVRTTMTSWQSSTTARRARRDGPPVNGARAVGSSRERRPRSRGRDEGATTFEHRIWSRHADDPGGSG